ncbi:VPS10 domain-containing receptor SorCS1 [Goodea atripinnis]|uniref:VPS10 domain-containing receptor SorCS1 n=1 Tax=Goodea atripinnis TaxID=208336 RepID=A0ABV0N8P8_9TELE
MKLPKYTLPKELHVISTDENRVVAAVQEWNQNETYNLYVSDTSGVYYTLALENVVSSMGLEGNIMVDLYEVNKHQSDRSCRQSRKLDGSVGVWFTF